MPSPQQYRVKIRRGKTWFYVAGDDVEAARIFAALTDARIERDAWLAHPQVDAAEVEIVTA